MIESWSTTVLSLNTIQNASSAVCISHPFIFGYFRSCDDTEKKQFMTTLACGCVLFMFSCSQRALALKQWFFHCVVVVCTNGGGCGKGFFGFPRDKVMSDRWIGESIRREESMVNSGRQASTLLQALC